jgi:ribosomal protein S18 acetylase RimI-like enzyme
MQNFIIRRYRYSDFEGVIKLNQLGLIQMGVSQDRPDLDEDLNNIDGIYLKSKGEFLIVKHHRKVIGMGALQNVDNYTAVIKRMRVHPDFQRKGYGQAILDKLTHKAKELGYKSLRLDTLSSNVLAQQLYKKNDFIEYKREIRHGFERVYFEKELTSDS